MEARGDPWKPVEAHGTPWRPVEVRGGPWNLFVLAGLVISKDYHDPKITMMHGSEYNGRTTVVQRSCNGRTTDVHTDTSVCPTVRMYVRTSNN